MDEFAATRPLCCCRISRARANRAKFGVCKYCGGPVCRDCIRTDFLFKGPDLQCYACELSNQLN